METYRPKSIEFEVADDNSIMPETFGKYETPEEMIKFCSDFIAMNQGLTVNRHMDSFEKKELRVEYNDFLENELPKLERKLADAMLATSQAKKVEKDNQEIVNATLTTIKSLAKEVKIGLKAMNLDELFTFRIPFQNKYYFYTYMDQELKLCKIIDIPDHEKNEIFNAMSGNDEFFNNHFNNEDGTTEA